MYNEVITLIAESVTVDEYGDKSIIRSERSVFAKLQSIGQSEFYQAMALGLKPEIKFILPDFLEYNNEKLLKYHPFNGNEEEYTVIRTYRSGNELELICKRGVDNANT